MTLILGIAGSFIAITGFAVLLETPRKYVPLAGLVGAIGGGIYLYCTQKEMDVVLASFLSALAIAFVSHVFARVFKAPVTVFLIAGMIALAIFIMDTVFRFRRLLRERGSD